MADFQELKDQILGLMESLEEVQASSDPETGYALLAARIEKLEQKLETIDRRLYAKLEAIMEKLSTLDPFYYPITTTWPQKDANPQPPYQPFVPYYEQPYKIICEGGFTNGITYGSNSAKLEELQTLAEPLRTFRRRRTCR